MFRFGLVLVCVMSVFIWAGCLEEAVSSSGTAGGVYDVSTDDSLIVISAGGLRRTIDIKGGDIFTTDITIAGENVLSSSGNEVSFRIEKAVPNRCPEGLDPETAGSVVQKTAVADSTDALKEKTEGGEGARQEVEWKDARDFSAKTWGGVFDLVRFGRSRPDEKTTQVIIRARVTKDEELRGVAVNMFYQVYDGHPAIRKWVEVVNNSSNWIKLSNLVIDDISLKKEFQNTTDLTPSERGAVSSVVGFSNSGQTAGAIFASEVPSALRSIESDGAIGYNPEHFEWVLGPGETFTSEPVFMYGFSGDVVTTISAKSLPLDRVVEKPFKEFLKTHVGMASTEVDIPAPVWCTWTNFAQNVNDEIIREQADIAARAGFDLLQIDDGWQRGRLGVIPDTAKFPDFLATCRYVRSRGLKLGLWVSCFRQLDSDDIKALPNAPIVPRVKRHEGVAMSFSSPWSEYYGNQLAYLHDYYGATYFKQDFTNIRYGDLAKGHYSRTKKESLLRGLRGLLESQAVLRRQVPEVANQITHEIYWGTPGVPCDLAALKVAPLFHIPPNDYSGVGHWKQRHGATDWWDKVDPKKQAEKLIKGCFNSRNRFYMHRGLPLESIEYYGASTVNCKGSLTGEIQDRQICSWLMGGPSVYAGDMASLTDENIERYRVRFGLLKRLRKEYDIYRHFQYSGVPGPTDTDWHWWGKLNDDSEGVVVVVRGSGGEDERLINIPWVDADRRYEVKALFADKELGVFRGADLIKGKLEMGLPKYGQEILEVKIK